MLTIGNDERAALHLDELASALDAGLPLASLGGGAPQDERAVHTILSKQGVVLSPTEDAMLLAAWRAGRVTAALRARATQRRQRAEFQRAIWAGLRYPLLLLVMVIVASLATAPIIGHYWFAIGVALGIGGAVVFALLARRGLRNGDERWTRVPVLGALATNLAELPYLETLHSMYGSGVPLLQAHTAAVAAVPVLSVQRRLRIADGVLQGGSSLTESLAKSLALQPETRSLLATGEQSGQLEDTLQRVLTRRREVTSRSVSDTARRFTAVVYGIAMVLAAAIVITFWLNLYSGIGRGGRH